MIAASDVVVFVVSPDSAASKVFDEEIAWARGLGKRIIAILRRQIDFAKAPPRLSALNVKIRFTDDSIAALAASLDELSAALDLNVAWYRESRRLTALAVRWAAIRSAILARILSPGFASATTPVSIAAAPSARKILCRIAILRFSANLLPHETYTSRELSRLVALPA